MPKIVIADTSCLIVLDKLSLLELLNKLYSEIITTPEIASDVMEALLILDDLQARKIAAALSLNFTGTLGVLVKAKQSNLLESINPVLQRLKEVNFRVSSEIEEDILKQCGES